MKKNVLVILLLLISSISNADDGVRGELRTEINGFQWYCYQNKEAYTIENRKLFTDFVLNNKAYKINKIQSIRFLAADNFDEGIFVVDCENKAYDEGFLLFNRNGDYLCAAGDNTNDIKRIKETFFNKPTKYFTRSYANRYIRKTGRHLNAYWLYDDKGTCVIGNYSWYKIVGNVFIVKKADMVFDSETYKEGYQIVNNDGKVITETDLKSAEFIKEANHILVHNIWRKGIIDAITGRVLAVANNIYYDKGIIRIEGENKNSGLMSYDGNWIISPEKGYSDYTVLSLGGNTFVRVKYKNSSRYRLISSDGIDVLKSEYDDIEITNERYVKVKSNNSYGVFTLEGKVIIPTSRGYTFIGEYNSSKGTFAFTKKGYNGVCNAQGTEISTTRLAPTADDIKANGGFASAVALDNGNTKYYKVSKGGRYGLTDSEGKVIVPAEMEALESAGTGYLRYKLNGFWGLMNYQGKILIDTDRGYTSIGDFKSFNKRFAYTMNGYKGECDTTGRQISKIKVDTPNQNTSVASSTGSSLYSSSSSSSSSSSNGNSGNNTTTIHVEHHRDPVPVQEWVQCTSCWGSGNCRNCAGSGTTYIGSNLHRCTMCGGRGRCTTCSGQGGRYYTVYK